MERHYCRIAFGYGIHVQEVLAANPEHNKMMARQLDGLWDDYFLRLQLAANGQYKPTAAIKSDAPAGSKLLRAAERARTAIAKYKNR